MAYFGEYDIKKDIFHSSPIITDKAKESIRQKLMCFVGNEDMGKLYQYLIEYNSLCEDYRNCVNTDTKKLISNRLAELTDRLKYFVVIDVD